MYVTLERLHSTLLEFSIELFTLVEQERKR